MYVIRIINNDKNVFTNKYKINNYLVLNTQKEFETYGQNWARVVEGKLPTKQRTIKAVKCVSAHVYTGQSLRCLSCKYHPESYETVDKIKCICFYTPAGRLKCLK